MVAVVAIAMGIAMTPTIANAAPVTHTSVAAASSSGLAANVPVHPDYVPGVAIPYAPVYTPSWGMDTWKCQYSGWAGAAVVWKCREYDLLSGTTLGAPGGTSYAGSWSTPLMSHKPSNSTTCVTASAYYSNGTGEDAETACN
jgi:hypothetical protein